MLGRLFMEGREPNERGINEFLDQAAAAIHSDSVAVRKAVVNSVLHFAELGVVYERMAKSAMRDTGIF